MEFTNPWDCWYTSPGARNFGHCCTSQVRASSERPTGFREVWIGRKAQAQAQQSVKWQACPSPPSTPRLGLNQRAIQAPPFHRLRPMGPSPEAEMPQSHRFCSKQACVWNHNILGSDLTHITFLVLGEKKKKELEEWKWEVLKDGNSFSSLVNDVNKGKIKLLSVKGLWKDYQATIIKSKLKGYIIHSASVASPRPDRTECASEHWGGSGQAVPPSCGVVMIQK